MLVFDEERHEYRYAGAIVPHVTQIIKPLTNYDRIPVEALERARQQGVAVHKMVELDCKNDLDVARLPAWMHGCYTAWRRFVDDSGFECWKSEHKIYHHKLGYAGTLDLAGVLPRLRTSKRPAVIDVKRSFYAGAAIGLQTAGYADAWNVVNPGDKVHERYALVLYPAGTYRIQPYEDGDDRLAFLACLQQLRWKEKHYGTRRAASDERAAHDDAGARDRAAA